GPDVGTVEDRVAPSAGVIPLDFKMDGLEGAIAKIKQLDNPDGIDLNKHEAMAADVSDSAGDGAAKAHGRAIGKGHAAAVTKDASKLDDLTDQQTITGNLKVKKQKKKSESSDGGSSDMGGDEKGGGRGAGHLVVATRRNFLVPIRIVPESVDVTADIVSVVERSAPSATTTSTPGATSTPTATPAIAASAAATP